MRLLGSYALLGLLAAAQVAHGQIRFTDVAGSVGLTNDKYDANQNHGLGAACLDFDRDGWTDLFLVNGKGRASHLYHNQSGVFVVVDHLLPPLPNVEKVAAIYGDIDNDGDSDIYIITDNEFMDLDSVPIPNPPDGPANILLKNLFVESGNQIPAGGPLFQNITVGSGLEDLIVPALGPYPGYRGITGAFLDYDRDGWIDVYVGHWSCGNQGSIANWIGCSETTATTRLPTSRWPWDCRHRATPTRCG